MKNSIQVLFDFFGVVRKHVSHTEKIISALGGFMAILCVLFISRWFIGSSGAELFIASMGASAVLLFAVPHGQLSQPWPVLGGHVISAIVGVTCAQFIGYDVVAACSATGLAIAAMYYLKCIHPPGGATALTAVMGSDAIHQLGYQFVITPVLVNVVLLLIMAFLFNYFLAGRRYPLYMQKDEITEQEDASKSATREISHEDYVYAISKLDSYIDISEYDLNRIYEMATNHAHTRHLDNDEILLGSFYSNGKFGNTWSVRQVVDESMEEASAGDTVAYEVVAGDEMRSSGNMPRTEFAKWAKYKVIKEGDNWQREIIAAPESSRD